MTAAWGLALALAAAAAGAAGDDVQGARFGSVYGLMGRAVATAREDYGSPVLAFIEGRTPSIAGRRRETWFAVFRDAEDRTFESVQFYDGDWSDPCERAGALRDSISCRDLRVRPQDATSLVLRSCGALDGDFVDSTAIEARLKALGVPADGAGQYDLALVKPLSVSACLDGAGLRHMTTQALYGDRSLAGKAVWLVFNGREALAFAAKDGRLLGRYRSRAASHNYESRGR